MCRIYTIFVRNNIEIKESRDSLMIKKIILIINPISGTQSKKKVASLLNEVLDKKRFSWKVVYTEYAGHASIIAADAVKEEADIVVAVGGDGTINEVARSLVHTNTALAIIPFGSGNGLARHLEIPMDPRKALEIINTGVIELVDYGKINEHPFFCTCGVGFDAFVSMKFAEAGRRGMFTYLEKTLQESLTYEPETYELETEDGTEKHHAFLIACANASQYGNNAYIAPQATMTDGLMDVVILEPFTLLDIPSLSFQLFNKNIDHNSRIKSLRCKKLHIRRKNKGVIHCDGDPIMAGEDIYVELIEDGLYLLSPPHKSKDSFVPELWNKTSNYFNGLRLFNDAMGNKGKKLLRKIKDQQ